VHRFLHSFLFDAPIFFLIRQGLHRHLLHHGQRQGLYPRRQGLVVAARASQQVCALVTTIACVPTVPVAVQPAQLTAIQTQRADTACFPVPLHRTPRTTLSHPRSAAEVVGAAGESLGASAPAQQRACSTPGRTAEGIRGSAAAAGGGLVVVVVVVDVGAGVPGVSQVWGECRVPRVAYARLRPAPSQ
jgi:hypothetical protein